MNEKDAVLALWNKTSVLIDEKLSHAYYDKTFPSIVYGRNDDGTYKIVREGVTYNVRNGLGINLKVGQNVWVTMPNGMKKFKDMYISGIRDIYEITETGGAFDGILTKSDITNTLGYTPYSPTQVDNKFNELENNTDWKESVETYDEILTTYPNPVDGWMVNVKDTDYTYRYNGTEWIPISANAISKASTNNDGLMSKEDYSKLAQMKITRRITNEEIDALFK